MSRENVEIVRRAIDAFNQRDVDEMVREWDPKIEVDWSRSRGPEAGIYHGQEAALGLWTAFFEMFDRATVYPDEFIECREHVVVPNRTLFRGRDHVGVEAQSAVVATVLDGRIVNWRLYQTRIEALQALGISEQDAARGAPN